MLIHTVGHGARSIEAFLTILTEADVATLVDVRRYPVSRRHPHFGREALASAVRAAGRQYHFRGETLGGRRTPAPASRHTVLRDTSYADHMETPAFRTALTELVATTERPAIMCAETLWRHCHRMLIADALVLRGADVEHLISAGSREPHRLTTGCRRDPDGWPAYDTTPTLPGL